MKFSTNLELLIGVIPAVLWLVASYFASKHDRQNTKTTGLMHHIESVPMLDNLSNVVAAFGIGLIAYVIAHVYNQNLVMTDNKAFLITGICLFVCGLIIQVISNFVAIANKRKDPKANKSEKS